ncbi:hypothetical protein ACIRPU_16960 [Streptomyces sp. NPDC102259]|uniref:hypothetical protein n=1 Tax=Streptomyces sp. NPDC102259 TaxID=3366148 RepID=UPI0038096B3C
MTTFHLAVTGSIPSCGSDEEFQGFAHSVLQFFNSSSESTLHLAISLHDRTFDASAAVEADTGDEARTIFGAELRRAFKDAGAEDITELPDPVYAL